MSESSQHKLILKGEIVEVLEEPNVVKTRILCRPGSLVFELENKKQLKLGDQVLLSGKFLFDEIENLK